MSSNRNMALDTFRQVAYTIEDNQFLKDQVRQIRLANGQESITLLSGARYEIAAATRDAPRGKSCGFLYLDEIREWSEEAFTAALPTTRAVPGSMTLMTSNAGDGFSTVLNDLRERSLSYPPPTLGFYEWSAPQHCKINDRKAWAMSNPALGHLITEQTLEESVNTNSIEATRTEMLCQWIDSAVSPWVYGSIVFDGTNDLIIKNPPFTGLPSSQLSVFIWIKFNDLSAVYYELVSQGRTPSNYEGEWVLTTKNVSSSIRLSFFDYNSGYGFNTVNGNTILVTNQWYHLGFIKNGTSGTFYVQGSQDGTSTGINKTYTDTGYVIGGGYRDSSHYLSGNIASTQIYNRALSTAEITQNYNATKGRFGL